jgi:uncharacterized protein (DUF2267 family)
MSTAGLPAFDHALQKTNLWLDEIMRELYWTDRQRAYHALQVVLHALRDHLPLGEMAQLAAQLPQLIRGLYYEGWRPSATPVKARHWDQFVAQVTDAFARDLNAQPEQIIRAVLKVLGKHVSAGEIIDVKRCLPEEIRRHWP